LTGQGRWDWWRANGDANGQRGCWKNSKAHEKLANGETGENDVCISAPGGNITRCHHRLQFARKRTRAVCARQVDVVRRCEAGRMGKKVVP